MPKPSRTILPLAAVAGPIAWDYPHRDGERYLRGALAGHVRELCLVNLSIAEAKRLLARDLRADACSSKPSESP